MSYAVIRSGLGQGGPGGTTGTPKTQADYDKEKNYAAGMNAALLTINPNPTPAQTSPPSPAQVNVVTVASLTPAQQAAMDAQVMAQRIAKPSELQLLLGVPITGTYDLVTRSAVKVFQTVRGLPPTGEPDAATANLLASIMAKDPKACPVPTDVRMGDLCTADISEARPPDTKSPGTKSIIVTSSGGGWWAAQSTMMKAVIVGGGAVALLVVLSAVGGKQAAATPNRRRRI
jgi:hypothetical protein